MEGFIPDGANPDAMGSRGDGRLLREGELAGNSSDSSSETGASESESESEEHGTGGHLVMQSESEEDLTPPDGVSSCPATPSPEPQPLEDEEGVNGVDDGADADAHSLDGEPGADGADGEPSEEQMECESEPESFDESDVDINEQFEAALKAASIGLPKEASRKRSETERSTLKVPYEERTWLRHAWHAFERFGSYVFSARRSRTSFPFSITSPHRLPRAKMSLGIAVVFESLFCGEFLSRPE